MALTEVYQHGKNTTPFLYSKRVTTQYPWQARCSVFFATFSSCFCSSLHFHARKVTLRKLERPAQGVVSSMQLLPMTRSRLCQLPRAAGKPQQESIGDKSPDMLVMEFPTGSLYGWDRYHIIPQFGRKNTTYYTTYILLIGWLYITYHLLREPETAIDMLVMWTKSSKAFLEGIQRVLLFGVVELSCQKKSLTLDTKDVLFYQCLQKKNILASNPDKSSPNLQATSRVKLGKRPLWYVLVLGQL